LANVAKQYRVTYDIGDSKNFVVHGGTAGLPNMHFKLHETGLHIYNPRNDVLSFVNTVEENMQGFTKQQIEGAHAARRLFAKLAYPSMKDFE
jgi:hypothetical protein